MFIVFFVPSPNFEVTAGIALQLTTHPNGCTKEETIILNWNEYISQCIGDTIFIPDILNFITGASRVPAVGFD